MDLKEFQTVQKYEEEDLDIAERIEYFGTEIVVPKQIYGPMEDTDLSIRFLRSWLQTLAKNNQQNPIYSQENPLRVMEMGCGSGALSFYVVSRLEQLKIPFYHMGIDINPMAIKACKYTSKLNGFSNNVRFKCGSFFEPLGTPEEKRSYDIIIFNPPYLASEAKTITRENRKLIDLAWEGGPEGNEITLEFFKIMSPFLSPKGEIMIISSGSVDQIPILSYFEKLNIKIVETLKKHVFFEDIILYHGKREP
ncbi:Release factor glutamine methyltransferase [Candidatus Lokiarchaeum ossiferum]|uniref:Release factor glutamine methyltransferase n=1 Tax=Candidatus Lokiarchaeum ossiferum TaxID=2951803 RepID=A0ABY6HT04_9ARCH|nr:Release factor glutamine methyltransferase [Candidatus Lokiarchaeum sp. B-35]